MKRFLLFGGLALVLGVAALAYLAYSRLDRIVEAALEQYGSEITQTRVRVDGVQIDPVSGRGALRQLTVGPPEGFEADPVVQLGEVVMTLDVASLASDPIVIREVSVERPSIAYEIGLGGSNLDRIQRNVEQYVRAMGAAEAAAESDEPGRKLVIERLRIRGGQVSVRAGKLEDRALTAPLPDLDLRNIGKAQGGATPGEVARQVTEQLARGVKHSVSKLDLERVLGEGLGGIGGALEQGAKDAGGGLKRLLEGR